MAPNYIWTKMGKTYGSWLSMWYTPPPYFSVIHMRLIKSNTFWHLRQKSKQCNHVSPFPPLIEDLSRMRFLGLWESSNADLGLLLWSEEPMFVIDAWLISGLRWFFVWGDMRKQSQVSMGVSSINPPAQHLGIVVLCFWWSASSWHRRKQVKSWQVPA